MRGFWPGGTGTSQAVETTVAGSNVGGGRGGHVGGHGSARHGSYRRNGRGVGGALTASSVDDVAFDVLRERFGEGHAITLTFADERAERWPAVNARPRGRPRGRVQQL